MTMSDVFFMRKTTWAKRYFYNKYSSIVVFYNIMILKTNYKQTLLITILIIEVFLVCSVSTVDVYKRQALAESESYKKIVTTLVCYENTSHWDRKTGKKSLFVGG